MSAYMSAEMKRFNNVISELNEVYHNAALKLGLSDSAMQILYAICDGGGECLLSDIVNMTGISKQTINSALRKLEAQKIVETKEATQRKKKVCLTHEGRILVQKTVKKVIDIENDILESWSQEEWETYFTLTQQYMKDFHSRIEKL